MVDDFGSIGLLAERYFYDRKTTLYIVDKRNYHIFPNQVLKAYKTGKKLKKFCSLLSSANKGWQERNKESCFGTTYQTITASEWGKLNLAMNISMSFTKHIKKRNLEMYQYNTENKRQKI